MWLLRIAVLVALPVVGSMLFLGGCQRDALTGETVRAVAPPFYSGPEPLVIVDCFASGNLWNVTPNVEQPSFVLYGDGTAIVRRGTASPSTYVRLQCDPEVVAGIVVSVDRMALESFDGQTLHTRTASDQGVDVLLVRRDDGTFITIALYGGWSELDPGDRGGVAIPEPIHRAFRAVAHLDVREATPWQPQEYEVYFQGESYRASTPSVWPEEWPLPHRRSRDALWETSRIANVSPSEVAALLGRPDEYSPRSVRVGQTVQSVRYRPVFPYEGSWRRLT